MAWFAVEDEGAIRGLHEITTRVVVEMSIFVGATDTDLNRCCQVRVRL